MNENWSSQQRLRTSNCFENEAEVDSTLAYSPDILSLIETSINGDTCI